MTRLTDEELKDFAEYCEGNGRAMRAIAELRARRAAELELDKLEAEAFQRGRESVEHWKQYAQPALSAEDVEALRFAAKVVSVGDQWAHRMHDPVVREHVEKCRCALAVLSRIIGGRDA